MTTSVIRAGGTGVAGVQTTGGDDGALSLKVGPLDTTVEALSIASSGAVTFNDAGADVDFRVESDGDANMLFVDGGNNRVGIGTAAPAQSLTVSGAASRIYLINNSENIDMDASANGHLSLDGSGYAFGIALNATAANLYTNSASRAVIFGTDETERVRIAGDGNVTVGTDHPNPVADRENGAAIGADGWFRSRTTASNSYFGISATSGVLMFFYTDNGSAYVVGGNIAQNGGTTAYNATSDYRLKNNIQPLTDALSRVALLRPVKWTWKEELGGTEPNGEGFVAHELAEILPMAVTGEKDAVDAEGKPEYQGVDTKFLVATLTAAIQEQQATIEALTTRITALEG